jgi:glucosylceramidase
MVLLVTTLFSQQKVKLQQNISQPKAKQSMFTSTGGTKLRLTKTDNLQFTDLKQPLETQLCVFVNPTKTFQTYLGIGGAITDASAEVFAKLTKENQQEFLNYYDKEKIGYSIIRTNIHSCDFSSGHLHS